jgi:dihydrofolate synthase/folylpolyglutamate synthase
VSRSAGAVEPPAWQRALFERRAHGVKLDLSAVRAAFQALGRPAGDTPAIHIVGTNGKGSTAAMCSHALTRHGRRVGLFTSPHLHRVGERVRIDGAPLADDELRAHVDRVLALESCSHALPRALTFFETITLAAMVAFAAREVDTIVLEAGMGGRLDATRIGRAVTCAITSVGLDHQRYLGATLTAIAKEKADVMAFGTPVVSAPQRPEVHAVLSRVARARGSSLRFIDPLARAPRGLAGEHQRVNGALALASVRHFIPRAGAEDLDDVAWPGRLERVDAGGGVVVFDVAHNPDGVRALVAAAETSSSPSAGRVFVFSCMADKDAASMLATLSRLGDPIWVTPPSISGARDPRELAGLLSSGSPRVFDALEGQGLRAAWVEHLERGGELWVCGSTFLVAALRRWVRPADCDVIELRDPLQRGEGGRSFGEERVL